MGDFRWQLSPLDAGLNEDALTQAAGLLEQGVADGRHPGAQLYLSHGGQAVLEFACGEVQPGRPMDPDALLPWFSASKPLTAMAIALLYDRGKLDLDDPIARYIPGWGAGKERCTLRHVLTHTGGFAGAVPFSSGLPWEEIIARIAAHPAEYEPGTHAGYHSSSGWYVLADVLQRVDGRPISQFLDEELCAPLGLVDSHLTYPPALAGRYRDRLADVQLGETDRPHYATQSFVDHWNSTKGRAECYPSGGMRGPARELGRFYELLLAKGQLDAEPLLDRRTVELFTATHRWDLPDQTLLGAKLAWGLGFGKYGNADIHSSVSRRMYGHSGMVSCVAFADPARELVCVVLTTGLLDALTNARRLREVTGAVLSATDGI